MKSINYYLNYVKDLFIKENGDLSLLGKLIKICILFIIIKIIICFIQRFIKKTLEHQRKENIEVNDKRALTLGILLNNTVKYILYFIGILITLDEFGINTASIIATAGVGGIAIGFGAQSIVKDVITGFFILLEDQFSVGDYVQIGSNSGIVEELGLRVTKVKGFNGELHIIPNSSIQIVTNSNKGNMRAWVNVLVPFEEDIEKATKALEEACLYIQTNNESVVDGPSLLGITELEGSFIRFSIVAYCKADTQWSVERDIRKIVVDKFNEENISIPYPRKVIVGGNEN
ncbi:MAG: mechanosensitive ion channel family protein [Tissierellia bacterium]|nr:mechanosensitive ion channel family protein [Tissierellia bacterium]